MIETQTGHKKKSFRHFWDLDEHDNSKLKQEKTPQQTETREKHNSKLTQEKTPQGEEGDGRLSCRDGTNLYTYTYIHI